jgi:hypothetical protein
MPLAAILEVEQLGDDPLPALERIEVEELEDGALVFFAAERQRSKSQFCRRISVG